MNKYVKSINYLISKKTQQISHHNKSLFQHLINVYDQLRKWKCKEDICFAGLLHSIYGNEFFTHKIETERSVIKDLIGIEAEQLVFEFNQNRYQNKNTRIISLANALDHDMILTFDNHMDKYDIDSIYFYFRDVVSWGFLGSGVNLNKWRKFNYDLKFNHKIEKLLKNKTETILKELHMFDLLKLERVYASANPYGTIHESHTDYSEQTAGGITLMYYLNNHWVLDNAGETVFYDANNQDILKSVIPKPGRVVVFNGSIKHCARDVRRDLADLRMVLTFKYLINLD
tara:strand:- start:349 stop:1206 length:858 start_codon:yes stop_codon:yes gene_type:complete